MDQLKLTPEIVECSEKASLRMVCKALDLFKRDAASIFASSRDLAADAGEDTVREAMDRLGVSAVPQRLLGKVDYKRAAFLFSGQQTLTQALFIDSKAEKGAENNARIQLPQISMLVRDERSCVMGQLPQTIVSDYGLLLCVSIFVKFHYSEQQIGKFCLEHITALCIPNGLLQAKYNPSAEDNIWNKGPHSTQRNEAFRARINFQKLKSKARWRVQTIRPDMRFTFEDYHGQAN